MSLRAKLMWAFVLVALVALIPAALIVNAGVTREMGGGPMMRRGQGSMMGPGMMRQNPGESPVAPWSAAEERRLAMESVRAWSVWAAAAAFALAGGAGWWISWRITRSLSHLRTAAGQLDLRDLSRRVPVEGTDEIADVARSFNVMCDRLEVEEKARRQLLADVAHELRHPLAVMKGRLDLMQDGKVEVDQEALLPLQDEVIRLTRLVGDLRDLSLAEVGGLSLHLASVDVNALLETLLTNMEPVAAAKEVALTAGVEPGLPAIQADPDRIRQVLVNLLANALQYTPQGGQVQVTAVPLGGQVVICVRDTGPGIPPEELPRIFDRFYRADKSRSRGTGGSGLGLAIVRSIVELHKGSIRVESKTGEGACFTVTLPAA